MKLLVEGGEPSDPIPESPSKEVLIPEDRRSKLNKGARSKSELGGILMADADVTSLLGGSLTWEVLRESKDAVEAI